MSSKEIPFKIAPEIVDAVISNPNVLDLLLGQMREPLSTDDSGFQLSYDSEGLTINFVLCDVEIHNNFVQNNCNENRCNRTTIIVKPLCTASEQSRSVK